MSENKIPLPASAEAKKLGCVCVYCCTLSGGIPNHYGANADCPLHGWNNRNPVLVDPATSREDQMRLVMESMNHDLLIYSNGIPLGIVECIYFKSFAVTSPNGGTLAVDFGKYSLSLSPPTPKRLAVEVGQVYRHKGTTNEPKYYVKESCGGLFALLKFGESTPYRNLWHSDINAIFGDSRDEFTLQEVRDAE